MSSESNSSPIIIGENSIESLSGSIPASNDQLQVFNYFPTSVFSISKPEFLEVTRQVGMKALDLRKKSGPAMDGVYPVYQTDNLFNDMDIKEFADYVGATAWNILESQGFNMTNKNVFFQELWCQEHAKYSGMDEHTHGYGAQIVGFYFLDVPANSSRVIIHDPRPAKKQINLPERDMTQVTGASAAINFTPEPGLLMMANSWLPHSFSRHENGDEPIRFIHFTIGVQDNIPATDINREFELAKNKSVQTPDVTVIAPSGK
jgi:hypothetical protein